MSLYKEITFQIKLTVETAAAINNIITAVDAVAEVAILQGVRVNGRPYSPLPPYVPQGVRPAGYLEQLDAERRHRAELVVAGHDETDDPLPSEIEQPKFEPPEPEPEPEPEPVP